MAEKPLRSIVKALTWRVTGTLDTVILPFIITGRLKFTLSIGYVELITKTVLYFFDERLWNRIKFGRTKEPEFYI